MDIITESGQIFGHVFLVIRTKIMFNGIIDVFTSVDNVNEKNHLILQPGIQSKAI